MHTEPVTRDYLRGNVVPFDNHRRRLRVEYSSAGETHLSGVVVRLPLPARSRTLERKTEAQPLPADNSRDGLTPIEHIVTFFLFLSALSGPALVWTLLSL